MIKQKLVISCPASSRSGYGNHSRDLIRSLIDIDKFDIVILDQPWGACPRTELNKKDNSDIAKLVATSQLNYQPDIWIQVTVPNEFQPVGKFNIGITAGVETDRVSPQWLEGMNRMDMNIVPSEHSARGFAVQYDKIDDRTQQKVDTLELKKPLEILFEGIDEKIYIKNPNKIDDNINECLNGIKEDFCFLVCGHWMNGERGQDRKDMHMTIETFLQTFKDMSKKNQPALILKTGVSFSVPEKIMIESKVKNIKQQYGDKAPNVYIVWGDLTDHEINSLYNHKKVKAMLSLTHGEGYGRPLAEFSITGKPVVVSDWSGHKDFISKYGILVPGELKNVHPSVVWENVILADSNWFYANYGYTAGVLKDIKKNYKKYFEKSRKQTQYMKDNFTLSKMTEKFDDILKKHLPDNEIKLPELEELKTYE